MLLPKCDCGKQWLHECKYYCPSRITPEIKRQVDAIKTATKEATKDKESANKFLKDAGVY